MQPEDFLVLQRAHRGGGTWKKQEELDIIKSGRIWYKQTDVHDVAVEVFQNTAIVWSRITLHAGVGGNDVVTEFTVTEVYQREGSDWKLLDLTFSSVRNTHKIQKIVIQPRADRSVNDLRWLMRLVHAS